MTPLMDVMRLVGCGNMSRDVSVAVMTLLFLIGVASATGDHSKVGRHSEHVDNRQGHSGVSDEHGEADAGSPTGNRRFNEADVIYSVQCGRYRKCDLRNDWCDEALGRCMSCAEDCSQRRIGGDELAARRCHQICSVYYRHTQTTATTTTTTNPFNNQQDSSNDQTNASRQALTTLFLPDWFTATVAATLCLITMATTSLVLLLVVHRYCCRHQHQQPPTEHRQLSFVGWNDQRQATVLRGVLVVEGLAGLHQQQQRQTLSSTLAAEKEKLVLVRALSDTVVVTDNGSTSSVATDAPLLGDAASKNVSI